MNAFSSLSTEDRWEEYDHSKILIFTPVGLIAREKVSFVCVHSRLLYALTFYKISLVTLTFF